AAQTELAAKSAVDRVILTVKTFDLEAAGMAIARGIDAPTPVLALQNGLGIEARLAASLTSGGWPVAERQVVRGVNTIPATFLGPGRVRLAGDGEVVLGRSGASDGGFASLLGGAGVRVRLVDSIDREVWKKALVNAAINPVTADHGLENGALVRDPWRGQALGLLHEARAVAEAEGFPFAAVDAEGELFRVVRATARNRSSMLQDLDAGRPTEVDAISGALLEIGRGHGLRLPNTERAVARIRTRVRERAAGSPPRAPVTDY
ncbi:MAG TPA: 2-dehydropantoate 2-reductase, partial [Thermoplasmata archaeon]|nr:2-dehydropantoate 2-reductase [Thermoplasmata archaeon]